MQDDHRPVHVRLVKPPVAGQQPVEPREGVQPVNKDRWCERLHQVVDRPSRESPLHRYSVVRRTDDNDRRIEAADHRGPCGVRQVLIQQDQVRAQLCGQPDGLSGAVGSADDLEVGDSRDV
mgnify:CR=1 FL=1